MQTNKNIACSQRLNKWKCFTMLAHVHGFFDIIMNSRTCFSQSSTQSLASLHCIRNAMLRNGVGNGSACKAEHKENASLPKPHTLGTGTEGANMLIMLMTGLHTRRPQHRAQNYHHTKSILPYSSKRLCCALRACKCGTPDRSRPPTTTASLRKHECWLIVKQSEWGQHDVRIECINAAFRLILAVRSCAQHWIIRTQSRLLTKRFARKCRLPAYTDMFLL